MLKFPSPLSGFSTPFGTHGAGTHGALSAYAIGSFEPDLVFDFGQEYYRTGGAATTFDSAVSFSRISNATYVDSTGTLQTAAPGVARVGHHVYNGTSWVNEGVLVEPTGAVQLLHTTNTLVTQSHTVTAEPHTLHFTGTGTVTLSGAYSGSLVGTGTGEENRVSLTFTPTAASLTLTVSGTVTNAQLEVGSTPSSYIPNTAASGTVTRAADTLTVPAANLPWPSPVVIGEELVTNGTFDTDLSGWTGLVNATWVSGAINCANGQFYQAGVFTGAKTVRLTWDQTVNSGTRSRLRLRNASGSADVGPFNYYYGTGPQSVDFSTSDGLSLWFLVESADDVTFDNISVKEINPLSVSIQMQGQMTYADEGLSFNNTFWRWYINSGDKIEAYLSTLSADTGNVIWDQRDPVSGADLVTSGATTFSPGVNVPFNIASRHGSTFVNGAVDGTALTANTTPTALPDLSTRDLNLAYSGGPMILKKVRIWADDIGDDGIEEASA